MKLERKIKLKKKEFLYQRHQFLEDPLLSPEALP
jgi:hypothetical protein